MPYHIGEKGSNGCSGYPVVSDTGHVAGCHPTEANAQEQLGALNANVADASKTDCCPEDITKQEPCWDGYVQRGMKPGDNGKMVPNCVPAEKADTPMDVAYNAVVTDPTPANPSSSINPSVGMKKPQYMMNFGRQVGSGIKDKRVVDIWTVKADAPMPENPIMPTQTYEGCECDYCAANELTCSQCPQCGGMDGETQMAAYDASLGKSDETPQEQPQETAQSESFFNFRDLRPTRNTVRLGE